MNNKLLELVEEVKGGKFDDNELIDLVLYLDKENKILLKENNELANKNQELKKQIASLRSGEYLNQLKFERDMLQDVIDKMKVSKEDKEFIDMTHRNTELLEENEQLKRELNALKVSEEEWLERNDK